MSWARQMEPRFINYPYPQFNIFLASFSFVQTYSFSAYLYFVPLTSDFVMEFFKAENYFLNSSNFM